MYYSLFFITARTCNRTYGLNMYKKNFTINEVGNSNNIKHHHCVHSKKFM